MQTITQQVLAFLSHPDLPFGTEADLNLLEDPEALRDRVGSLLDEFPHLLGAEESADLKAHLDEAAWSFIALEFQVRAETEPSFMDEDSDAAFPSSNNGTA